MESDFKKKPLTPPPVENNYLERETASESKDAKVSHEVKNFFAETTAHGFGNIVKPNTFLCYKISWVIIVITVLTGGMLHLSSVITSYLAYPSQENSQLLQDNPRFPDVTICNAQPLSDTVMLSYMADENHEWTQYVARYDAFEEELRDYNRPGLSLNALLLSPYGIYGTIDHGVLQNISHSLDNFVLLCMHANEMCEPNDWLHFFDRDYLNCYTYIGGRNLRSGVTGPNFGLSFILFFEAESDLRDIAYNFGSTTENAYGARLVIHDHGTMPAPTQQGIGILPGQSTSIGLRETRIHKLPEPWGKCTERKKLKHMKQYDYTTQSCMDMCMSMVIYDKCDCFLGLVPDHLQGDSSITYCGLFDNATVSLPEFAARTQCVMDTVIEFGSGDFIRDCNCQEKCSYRIFDRSLSQNQWPGIPFQQEFYRELVLEADNADTLLARSTLQSYYYNRNSDFEAFNSAIYRNFARINIYFESLDIIERRQYPSMTLTDMFANVGGTIGLWAGLSIVTVVEVVFLLIQLCGLGVKKCRKPRKIGESKTELGSEDNN